MFPIVCFTCNPEIGKSEDTAGVILVDNDGDGYFSDEDCNDLDPNIYPATIEIVMELIIIVMEQSTYVLC